MKAHQSYIGDQIKYILSTCWSSVKNKLKIKNKSWRVIFLFYNKYTYFKICVTFSLSIRTRTGTLLYFTNASNTFFNDFQNQYTIIVVSVNVI